MIGSASLKPGKCTMKWTLLNAHYTHHVYWQVRVCSFIVIAKCTRTFSWTWPSAHFKNLAQGRWSYLRSACVPTCLQLHSKIMSLYSVMCSSLPCQWILCFGPSRHQHNYRTIREWNGCTSDTKVSVPLGESNFVQCIIDAFFKKLRMKGNF